MAGSPSRSERRWRRLRRSAAAALAGFVVATATAAAAGPQPPEPPEPAAFWHERYAPAMDEARRTGRPLLLFFYTTWCQFCERMEATTLEDPAVRATLAGFARARVDAELDRVAARRFRPEGFPVVIVADPEGREIVRFLGYRGPEELAPRLAAMLRRMEELTRLSGRLESRDAEVRRKALAALGDLLVAEGFHERGFESLEEAARLSGEAAARESLLARAAAAAGLGGLSAEADRCYRRLIREFPGSPRRADYMLGRARALLERGRGKAARSLLARLQREFPGTAPADEARRLLAAPAP